VVTGWVAGSPESAGGPRASRVLVVPLPAGICDARRLNFGEHTYGETYAQALDATEYSYQTYANAKSVAKRVEVYRRRENLSFGHHAEVAALEPAEQDRWLDRAESEAWTRAELRAQVQRAKRRGEYHVGDESGTLADLERLVSDGRTGQKKSDCLK
jgi:hypothetical protein